MSKHTPGPRTVERCSDECGCYFAVHGKNYEFVANFEKKEDAILDTAAPDLLEALKMTQFGFNHARCPVCAGFENDGIGERDRYHNKDCPVRAALAKATA